MGRTVPLRVTVSEGYPRRHCFCQSFHGKTRLYVLV
jgi:hypothetical protein